MCLSANVVVLGPAMGFGYSAVTLGPLMSPSSDVKIDFNQANWIGWFSHLTFNLKRRSLRARMPLECL